MDNPELTPWFSCTIKPQREGCYEVKRVRLNGMVLDQKRAYFGSTFDGRRRQTWSIAIIDTQDFWRGLAKKP